MLHIRRRWAVTRFESAAGIAETITKAYACPLCTAFETAAGTIWANDSISEDSIQEYAVLRPGPPGDNVLRQVESITVTWCDQPVLEEYIRQADAGRFDEYFIGWAQSEQFEREHKLCPHCV